MDKKIFQFQLVLQKVVQELILLDILCIQKEN